MIERFIDSRKHGIYFKVVEEGDVQQNDEVILVEESPHHVTIADFVECYYSKGQDKSLLKKLLAIPYLPESKQKAFASFL